MRTRAAFAEFDEILIADWQYDELEIPLNQCVNKSEYMHYTATQNRNSHTKDFEVNLGLGSKTSLTEE